MDAPEEPKTALDELREFAGNTKRKIVTDQIEYPNNLAERITHTRKTVCIQDTADESCFLAGYHDPKAFGDKELWFGVFFTSSLPEKQSFVIRKKDILDKLNPFPGSTVFKTGTNSFDSRVCISGTDPDLMTRILGSSGLQQKILEIFPISPNLYFGLNNHDNGFIPAFQNTSVLGIYTNRKWITDAEILEELFIHARIIRMQLINLL
jgi:hypothetical protein